MTMSIGGMLVGCRSIVARFYPNAALTRTRSQSACVAVEAAYDSLRPTSTRAASPITVQPPSRHAAVAPVLAAGAALCFSVALYYPGFMSFDSAYQYWQARSGRFSNLSPVTMTALWRAVDSLWPSPAALLVLHFTAYWTGIALLAASLWRSGRARVAFVLAAGFVPPAFVVMGHLWTDASLIAAMSLALGLTAAGLARASAAALALALPPLLYAGAVRHNSLLAIVPVALLWARAVGGVREGAPPASRSGIAAIAAIVVASSFVAGRGLDHLLARERVATWALVAGWDLAAISVRTGTMEVPDFARTPGLTLEDLREHYTPLANVPVFVSPEHVRHGMDGEEYSGDELKRLAGAWAAAVAAHPAAYLRHRLALTTSLFGRYDTDLEGLFFTPGVVAYQDNPPAKPALWSLRDRYVAMLRQWRGSLPFAPWPYLALATCALVAAWPRRRSVEGRIAVAAAASGLLLVLPLPLVAPSAELRYSGWMFVASVVAAAACLGAYRAAPRKLPASQ
jgi:hypothetical protein